MVNIQKLMKELCDAGIPVCSVRETGIPVADYTRTLSDSEIDEANAIIAAHDPVELPVPSAEERIAAMEDTILAMLLGG